MIFMLCSLSYSVDSSKDDEDDDDSTSYAGSLSPISMYIYIHSVHIYIYIYIFSSCIIILVITLFSSKTSIIIIDGIGILYYPHLPTCRVFIILYILYFSSSYLTVKLQSRRIIIIDFNTFYYSQLKFA
jgi:hypothetical protein